MDTNTGEMIEWASASSMAGSTHFGEIVKGLLAAGVESYYADYRANRKTYYVPSGETQTMELPPPAVKIAQVFDGAAVRAAVLGAQKGEVKYPQFLELTRAAGCVGYIVWLVGRHVTYFGRMGETHVEHFPQ
jgi:uncharacterized protein YbcV (DUF1398 family)